MRDLGQSNLQASCVWPKESSKEIKKAGRPDTIPMLALIVCLKVRVLISGYSCFEHKHGALPW